MKTFIRIHSEQQEALPAPFTPADDVRGNPEIVRQFLSEYTREGDLVFDPFAGFGTTIITAESMNRRVLGIEYDKQRCNYIRERLHSPQNLIHGDARQLSVYNLPQIDFCMTSPPYMHREDPEDPFTAYQSIGRGYNAYLEDIREIYIQIGKLLTDKATAIVEVSNLKRSGRVTTLAWDVADVVSKVLHFKGEVIVEWDPTHAFGYDHSYCLIFSK